MATPRSGIDQGGNTWAVDTSAEAPVLDVRSSAPGLAALYGMFRRVQAAR